MRSIVGEAGASPPSAATDPSYYGPASTSATLSTAGAYVLGSLGNAALTSYAADLKSRALKAWTWAAANPNVTFKNNDAASNSTGLGAGQQETDAYGRQMMGLESAAYLFELTKDPQYQTFFDADYKSAHLYTCSNYAFPFEAAEQEALLYYTTLPGATAAVTSDIKTTYATTMNGTDNLPAFKANQDPYLAIEVREVGRQVARSPSSAFWGGFREHRSGGYFVRRAPRVAHAPRSAAKTMPKPEIGGRRFGPSNAT